MSELPGSAISFAEFEGIQIKFNTDDINDILNKNEILGRKVVAVSVVGACREGKSFLLDYCLRYCYFKYNSVNLLGQKDQTKKSQRWIGECDAKLTGFSWKCGADRNTTGIIFWSDVFLHDADNGDKFAIILIDTQGLFDVKTPMEVNSRIFSLTTLISSVQIYNLSKLVKENELEYLHFATEYAKFSQQGNNTEKPFQNLVFLIRDSELQSEFEDGFDGGSQYMTDKFLKIEDYQVDKMKELRKFITNSFENLKCFLMPHPGKASKRKDYDGSWSNLDEDFVNQLNILVPGILSPENLAAKKFNDKYITVSDYLNGLKIYAEYYSSSEAPSGQSMYESNVSIVMMQIIKRLADLYKEKISNQIENVGSEIEFENVHLRAKELVLDSYNNEKKMGSENLIIHYKVKLIEAIENIYSSESKTVKLIIQNKIAKDKKRAAEEKALNIKKECEEKIREEKIQQEKTTKLITEKKVAEIEKRAAEERALNIEKECKEKMQQEKTTQLMFEKQAAEAEKSAAKEKVLIIERENRELKMRQENINEMQKMIEMFQEREQMNLERQTKMDEKMAEIMECLARSKKSESMALQRMNSSVPFPIQIPLPNILGEKCTII